MFSHPWLPNGLIKNQIQSSTLTTNSSIESNSLTLPTNIFQSTKRPRPSTPQSRKHQITPESKRVASLESPEEIAAWIAERKKRYPTEANVALKNEQESMEKKQKTTPLCRYFVKNGNCRAGEKCRYRHEQRPSKDKVNEESGQEVGPKRRALMEMLTERDIEMECQFLLEFIKHLIKVNLARRNV